MTAFVRASLIAPLTAPLLYCVASLAVAVANPMRRASVGQNLFVIAPWLHGHLVSVPLAPWHGGILGAATAAVWWRLASR
jgi:hypothetical protein